MMNSTTIYCNHHSSPPSFDGKNFSHWKARMSTYLQTLDFEVWTTVENGWFEPLEIFEETSTGKMKISPKPRLKWSEVEKRSSHYNSIGLNAIFMAMNEKDFTRIRFCKTSKEAWNTLVKAFEWYKDDKETYLQLLDNQFKTMEMLGVADFHSKLQEVVNTSAELGHKYSDLEIKIKILSSFESWYRTYRRKDGIVEEHLLAIKLHLPEMSVDTLIGKLRTYEVTGKFVGQRLVLG